LKRKEFVIITTIRRLCTESFFHSMLLPPSWKNFLSNNLGGSIFMVVKGRGARNSTYIKTNVEKEESYSKFKLLPSQRQFWWAPTTFLHRIGLPHQYFISYPKLISNSLTIVDQLLHTYKTKSSNLPWTPQIDPNLEGIGPSIAHETERTIIYSQMKQLRLFPQKILLRSFPRIIQTLLLENSRTRLVCQQPESCVGTYDVVALNCERLATSSLRLIHWRSPSEQKNYSKAGQIPQSEC
jgi:hypothetical protein